ncbi:alpha/beta fold hydrolase [Carboxylicivirga sp. RSCT41]|uniref:alpha/beta fold hydrolase n=1 Tax=Carboxylicivirga agarovorans TaxID=3417570 RepID=UPI003D358015
MINHTGKTFISILLLALVLLSCGGDKKVNQDAYGKNDTNGRFIELNGSQIYFETYGNKEHQALVLIHGNGGSIASMSHQIDYFKEEYFVIVADNRTHGRSGGADSLNYKMMAGDYMAVINSLAIKSAHVLGHSDGGIIGLLMAINYPDKISKLVAAVPNIVPGEAAIESWELELSKQYRALIDSMIRSGDQSRNWANEQLHMNLMRDYPNITLSDLSKIKCPVLVMTSDNDIIKTRHILSIFENIPNAHLFVMPGATHFMIRDEHELYNSMSNRFLSTPFARPTSKDVLMEMIGLNE